VDDLGLSRPRGGSGNRPTDHGEHERDCERVVASLNHPHICTIHDVGEHDGAMFLVMEHLAGDTLAERLRKGPLPLEQALTVATEIADGLAAAHRQGVIHRDLMMTQTTASAAQDSRAAAAPKFVTNEPA
jgi:serine/threonine protein kinase